MIRYTRNTLFIQRIMSCRSSSSDFSIRELTRENFSNRSLRIAYAFKSHNSSYQAMKWVVYLPLFGVHTQGASTIRQIVTIDGISMSCFKGEFNLGLVMPFHTYYNVLITFDFYVGLIFGLSVRKFLQNGIYYLGYCIYRVETC